MQADRHQGHLKRRGGRGPDDALVVMMLLDGRGDQPGDADAVATHRQRHRLALFVQHGRTERLAVLTPELEHMAYLDRPRDAQGAAVRRGVVLGDIAQIGAGRQRHIAPPVDAEIMLAFLIGACGKISDHRDAVIRHDRQRHVDRPERSRPRPDGSPDIGLIGHGQRLGDLVQTLGLQGIELMVAAHQQCHQAMRIGLGLFSRCHDQGLDRAGDGQFKTLHQPGDRGQIGRVHQPQFLAGRRAFGIRRRCGGQVQTGRVIAPLGKHHLILAGLGEDVEFMRGLPADAAAVRRHPAELKPEAGEDPLVGGHHPVIRSRHPGLVQIEGIGVFHDEFAPAHHAEARAAFVAELGLNLIQVDRQLPVTAQLMLDQRGDDLFMRRPEAKRTLMAVLQPQQLRPVGLPAPGLLPQFRRLDHRQAHLLRPGGIHFLTHHRLDPMQHALTQRQPVVDARRDLTDQARAQHQPVTDGLGVGRIFAQRRQEQLRGSHMVES